MPLAESTGGRVSVAERRIGEVAELYLEFQNALRQNPSFQQTVSRALLTDAGSPLRILRGRESQGFSLTFRHNGVYYDVIRDKKPRTTTLIVEQHLTEGSLIVGNASKSAIFEVDPILKDGGNLKGRVDSGRRVTFSEGEKAQALAREILEDLRKQEV